MLVTLAPSMSRMTKVRSLVPPCFDTSAPRNTPGPCRFRRTKVPGGAGALSPCVRRGLQTPGAHVAVSACGRGGAFLRFAIWTSLRRGTSVPMEHGPQPCPEARALSRHAPLPGSRARSATVRACWRSSTSGTLLGSRCPTGRAEASGGDLAQPLLEVAPLRPVGNEIESALVGLRRLRVASEPPQQLGARHG